MIQIEFFPFFVSLGLLFALLVLEVIGSILGMSLFGESDADLDLDYDADITDFDFDAEIDIEPDVAELVEISDGMLEAAENVSAAPSSGFFGMGDVPFIIWLAALLTSFGVLGVLLQVLSVEVLGYALHWAIASALGLLPALVLAGRIARMIGRLVPKTETTATRLQFMSGLRGVVTQGEARRGMAAEVRLNDRHGSMHFIRCEPFADDDVIVRGTEVITVRQRIPASERLRGDGADDWRLRILPIPAE